VTQKVSLTNKTLALHCALSYSNYIEANNRKERKIMETKIIKYKTAVMVAAGWRSVSVTAEASLSKTGKMATVEQVLLIDGKKPNGYASRTGANRQKYNADSIAKREVGLKKRVSACVVKD